LAFSVFRLAVKVEFDAVGAVAIGKQFAQLSDDFRGQIDVINASSLPVLKMGMLR
jgi:hypothetical protein